MLNASPEYSEPIQGRSLQFSRRCNLHTSSPQSDDITQRGKVSWGACDKYNEQWMRFSCICWRGNLEGENKEPFSGQVSHHPLLFWLSAVLPDVNLLPWGTLVKWIGRQVNTKYRGEESEERVRRGKKGWGEETGTWWKGETRRWNEIKVTDGKEKKETRRWEERR